MFVAWFTCKSTNKCSAYALYGAYTGKYHTKFIVSLTLTIQNKHSLHFLCYVHIVLLFFVHIFILRKKNGLPFVMAVQRQNTVSFFNKHFFFLLQFLFDPSTIIHCKHSRGRFLLFTIIYPVCCCYRHFYFIYLHEMNCCLSFSHIFKLQIVSIRKEWSGSIVILQKDSIRIIRWMLFEHVWSSFAIICMQFPQ